MFGAREPAALFFTLALPLLLLTLNGGAGNAPQEMFGGAGLVDALTPGLLLMVMCTSGLMALPETLLLPRARVPAPPAGQPAASLADPGRPRCYPPHRRRDRTGPARGGRSCGV